MISKKIIIILMVIYVSFTVTFAYASITSFFVSKLAPAAAVVGSTGSVTLPAKILGTTSGGLNVASWISMLIPGGNVAKLAIAVLAVSGALAADYVELKGAAWFAANRYNHTSDDKYYQTTNVSIPNNTVPADFTGNITGGLYGSGQVKMGFYATAEAAQAACEMAREHHCDDAPPTCGKTSKCYSGGYQPDMIVSASRYYDNTQTNYMFFYPKSGIASYLTDVENPRTKAHFEADLAASLASGNQDAANLGKAAVDVVANAKDNPSHPVTNNTTINNTINNILNNNVTTNQLTNLEAAATPNVGDQVLPDSDAEKAETLTAAQIAAAVAAALANQGLSASQIAAAIAAAQSAATGGLTQAELASTLSSEGLTAAQIAAAIASANPAITQTQVKTAVKEAIDDETGITPPVDPTISLPEKLSLTTVMNDFWTSVQALPIFNVLNGITITTSGSSNLCIDLPADYGGQRCYNAVNVQDELNMIGSVILGLTTVVSFIGIFKG